ncbi:MAG: aa3-type cytochrome c oxidase subunit IV [Novosphingobium sp.]|nr:aa3-type cytochrome c oxidase subunit IV [Novosphingobium sp.]
MAHKDIKTAQQTYSGFVTLLKWSVGFVAIAVIIIVLLIS